jgi:hypothetical protein
LLKGESSSLPLSKNSNFPYAKRGTVIPESAQVIAFPAPIMAQEMEGKIKGVPAPVPYVVG